MYYYSRTVALKATPQSVEERSSVIFTFRVAFIASRILSESKRIFSKLSLLLGDIGIVGHFTNMRYDYYNIVLGVSSMLFFSPVLSKNFDVVVGGLSSASKAAGEVKIPRRPLHMYYMY